MPKRKPSPTVNATVVERVGLSNVKRSDGTDVHRASTEIVS